MLAAGSQIDDPRVSIGRYTYGYTRATFLLSAPEERVDVGSFCSIAGEVRLFGGGEHLGGVTSFSPALIDTSYEGLPREGGAGKGPTRIGNDVWIGYRAMVLSGVTVGDGAIIGAGAVVARDVPPYAVVAGNPARVVRLRFAAATIERLLAVRWWDWEQDIIGERLHLFHDVEAFLALAERDAA